VNLNDSGLTDSISSNPQNFPVLGSAMSAGGKTTISGYLNSRPGESFTLQFFSNSKLELSGFGEGETLVGTGSVTTDASGHADFTFTFDAAVFARTLLSATATDVRNETSEFSRRLAVGDVLGNLYTVNTTDDVDDGVADATHTSLREAIHAANNHPGPDTIRFAIGTGVQTIAPLTPLPVVQDTITIDGTTQPGFAGKPVIELIGTQMERNRFDSPSSTSAYLVGLFVQADNSVIRGLAINRFYNFIEQTATSDLWGG
jgi:CSLREA domain-containing protein